MPIFRMFLNRRAAILGATLLLFDLSLAAGLYDGGEGTLVSPYRIASAAQWLQLTVNSEDWGACFQLVADIDLADSTNLPPIGSAAKPFVGTFDGNGHTVANLTIDRPTSDEQGLFGVLGTAGRILNLRLANAGVRGGNRVGGLVGRTRGEIENCMVEGSVAGVNEVGGLAGLAVGAILTNSHASATVVGQYAVGGLLGRGARDDGRSTAVVAGSANGTVAGAWYVGGLVGDGDPEIADSQSSGVVDGQNSVGGLIGALYGGQVTTSRATGDVSGTASVGGLVGWMLNDGRLGVCYATGKVTGNHAGNYLGGLVGRLDEAPETVSINACYATGAVVGGAGRGGLVGRLAATQTDTLPGLVRASFYNLETAGIVGSFGGKGLASAEMIDPTPFANAGWRQFDWRMTAGQPPLLPWENETLPPVPAAAPVPFAGDGTPANPYLIATTDDFATLNRHIAILDAHLRLASNLDLASIALSPIGELGPFAGLFDGNGQTLKNATIERPGATGVGLFAHLGGNGEIRNLHIVNPRIGGRDLVGALAGWQSGGRISGCSVVDGKIAGEGARIGGLVGASRGMIENSRTATTVTGGANAGGLVGCQSGGSVSHCRVAADIAAGDSTGGLIGLLLAGHVEHCQTSGSIQGNSKVGGLIGGVGAYFPAGMVSVRDSFSLAAVNAGGFHAGGLIGEMLHGDLRRCYARGTVAGGFIVGGLIGYFYDGEASQSYATGELAGGLPGGLIPEKPYGLDLQSLMLDCYWDVEASGQTESGGGEGRTTAAMIHPHSPETYAGWDFDQIWSGDADGRNGGYPYLRRNPPPAPFEIGMISMSWEALYQGNRLSGYVFSLSLDSTAVVEPRFQSPDGTWRYLWREAVGENQSWEYQFVSPRQNDVDALFPPGAYRLQIVGETGLVTTTIDVPGQLAMPDETPAIVSPVHGQSSLGIPASLAWGAPDTPAFDCIVAEVEDRLTRELVAAQRLTLATTPGFPTEVEMPWLDADRVYQAKVGFVNAIEGGKTGEGIDYVLSRGRYSRVLFGTNSTPERFDILAEVTLARGHLAPDMMYAFGFRGQFAQPLQPLAEEALFASLRLHAPDGRECLLFAPFLQAEHGPTVTFEQFSATADTLPGEGWYVLEIHYGGETKAACTPFWFGAPAGDIPLPSPTQQPEFTAPQAGALVAGQTHFTWHPATDAAVNRIALEVGQTLHRFDPGAVDSGPLALPIGQTLAHLSFCHEAEPAVNPDGVAFHARNYCRTARRLTVGHTLTYVAGDGGEIVGASRQIVAEGDRAAMVFAAPQPGHRFVRWDDGRISPTRRDVAILQSSQFAAEFAPKLGQTIDFAELPPRPLSLIPLALTATATSGLPVVYSVDNPAVATVEGSVLSLHGVGDCVITAAQPGDTFWNPAPNVGRTLSVLPSEASHPLSLVAGWNAIAFPIQPLNPKVDDVFAGAGRQRVCRTPVWQWLPAESDGSTARFDKASEVHALAAYWVYCDEAAEIAVAGLEVPNRVEVQAGWNFFGTSQPTWLPAAASAPGSLWRWLPTARAWIPTAPEDLSPGTPYLLFSSEPLTID